MSKWTEKRKVRDIVEYEKGKAPVNTANEDLIAYLTPEFLRGKGQPTYLPNQSNFVRVDDGEIILLWDGSNAGEFFKAKAGVLSSTMTRLIFNKNEHNPDYLFHYFKSIEPRLKAQTSGSGIPHVDKQILGNFSLRKSDPAEQARIAHILSTVDTAIEQTEALIAKYNRVRTGIMQDLLTRGIDEQGRIRSEETHEFKDSPLGRIPVEWEITTVGALCQMTLGKMLNKDAKKGDDLFDYLGNRSVQWGRFDFADLEQMNFNSIEREKFKLLKGDVLMCEGGDVGRCAIWQEERGDCYFQKALHRLRFDQERMKSDFFVNYFKLLVSSGTLKDYVSQTSIAHLTQEKLSIIPFVRPQEKEQTRIIEALQKMDSDSQTELSRLRKYQTLKKSLMQDLLSEPTSAVTAAI